MTVETTTLKRILLADDNGGLRHSLAVALQDRGYQTIEATSGREAWDIGRVQRPHLSLLDINMPDMTGVDVYKGWLSEGLRMPVIFMTAEASDTLRQQALVLGAISILSKPFGAAEFLRLVRNALTE
ncbi:MAG: response regulator [Planctomycetes bacterium]|nr:response regulator [Planctomycetota bacterium]NUQ34930.1 response regulator [Planctomycetaceae bacterium]